MDRRKFLKASCAICGVAAIGATVFLESCKKEKKEDEPQNGIPPAPVNFTLDLTKPENAALNTPGGSVVSNGIVIIALASSYTALSQSCTHQGCAVSYNGSGMACPCHGGTYDIDGKVTGGPPPAPLKKYIVTKKGDILTIKA
jgi:Rieske Fe-S protein